MANKLQAIRYYTPRIVKGKIATSRTAAELIAGRTSATVGEIYKLLYLESAYALYFFLREGRSLKLDGIGMFTPSIGLNGKFRVNVRIDRELLDSLNKPTSGFIGEVENVSNIGKTVDELVEMWNLEFPGDLIV